MATHINCPFCGSDNTEEKSFSDIKTIDGKFYSVATFYRECDACGSEFSGQAENKKNSQAIIAVKKRACDLLSGEEVRKIRKNLGLTIATANLIFGGGPVAFSKYENDDLCQSSQTDILLKLARDNPQLLEEIVKLKGLGASFYTTSTSKVREGASSVYVEFNPSDAMYDPVKFRKLKTNDEGEIYAK